MGNEQTVGEPFRPSPSAALNHRLGLEMPPQVCITQVLKRPICKTFKLQTPNPQRLQAPAGMVDAKAGGKRAQGPPVRAGLRAGKGLEAAGRRSPPRPAGRSAYSGHNGPPRPAPSARAPRAHVASSSPGLPTILQSSQISGPPARRVHTPVGGNP